MCVLMEMERCVEVLIYKTFTRVQEKEKIRTRLDNSLLLHKIRFCADKKARKIKRKMCGGKSGICEKGKENVYLCVYQLKTPNR